jgi:hypothetical protein
MPDCDSTLRTERPSAKSSSIYARRAHPAGERVERTTFCKLARMLYLEPLNAPTMRAESNARFRSCARDASWLRPPVYQ